MLNTSELYKKLIKQSGREFRVKLLCTLENGQRIELTDNDIMQDSLKMLSSVSGESNFEIGSAIIGELDFEIDNSDGNYNNMSFRNAEFQVRIGLVTNQSYTGNLTVEWLNKGLFTAEEVTVNEKYISIVAYDNMAKFDKEMPDINFPATLSDIFSRICTHCGVAYTSLNFPNKDLIVRSNYLEKDTSCRDILSYIAQLSCSYAYINSSGSVSLKWFTNTNYFVSEKQRLNGTVSITGVQFTDVSDESKYLIGRDNYCLMIDDNPFVIGNQALQNNVWKQRLIGFPITPFETEILSDMSVEAGDIVTVSDLKGNVYRTPITSVTFTLDGKTALSCHAETIKENQRTRGSVSAKVMSAVRREAKKQISEYDIRAKMFSTLTANAMGYYQTEQIQDDGSVITFQHDKPKLSESQYIWKKSLDSFAVSSDYGHTWRGFDSNANAVLNILAVEGIVADWIKAGIISDVVGNVSIDMSNGNITMKLNDGSSLQIWTGGITMYDKNGTVLTSMFISTDNRGVLTANTVLVGERDNEKVSLFIDDNGKGTVLTDIVSVSGINISKNANGRLIISSPVVGNFSLEHNGNEIGSFYGSANGKAVLNTDIVTSDESVTTNKAYIDGIELSKKNNRLHISSPVVSDFSLENNGVEVGSFYTSANGNSVLDTNFAYINTLVVNGYSYSPRTITVDGQQITVLAR